MPSRAVQTTEPVQDPRQLALLKAVGLDKLNSEQRDLALNIAERYELDLLLKHLVLIDGKPYITRDGLLHVAHRSGQLDGIETTEPITGDDGYWHATAAVYRKDMSRSFTYSGRYPKNGQNQKFAPEMAVKVAEVMALRRAFDVAAPAADERWDVPEVAVSESAAAPSLAERAAARAEELRGSTSANEANDAPVAESAPLGPSPTRMLLQDEFMALAKANNVDKEQVKWAAHEVAPGVAAPELSPVQWGTIAETLGI